MLQNIQAATSSLEKSLYSILIGIIGAFITGFGLSMLGLVNNWITLAIVAIIGAVLLLLIASLILGEKNKIIKFNKIGFFVNLGAVIGIPMSYYFQDEFIKSASQGISGYLQNFGDLVEENYMSNVLVSVIVFAIIGGGIGYYLEKNKKYRIYSVYIIK